MARTNSIYIPHMRTDYGPGEDTSFSRDLGSLVPPNERGRSAQGATMWPTFGDQYSGGNSGNYFGAGFDVFGQGLNTMSNLGNTIGGSFALANAQSGRNLANRYAFEAANAQALYPSQAAMYAEAQKTARLNAVIPALLAAFSRGAGGSGMTGFSTNYGAGGSF